MPRIYRKRPKVSRRPKRRAPKTFAKKVKAVIHQLAENKCCYESSGDALLKFSGNLMTMGVGAAFPCLPTIFRGTNEGERIGNQIRSQSLNFKGCFIYTPTGTGSYSPTQSRVGLRVMVVQPKHLSAMTQVESTSWYGSLLQKGNATSGFNGRLQDLWAPINRDAVTVYHDKVHYITCTQVSQVTAAGYYMIENGPATKFFNIKIPCRNKLLRYDDSLGTGGIYPTNFSPILLVGYVYLDGSAPAAATDMGISYTTTMEFEDM